ncbi:adenine-specific DNA-methyltransferase [Variovorax boronicumulans]|uniref:HsdM family class I SAM-dependent methyltransferase n=1 Tax=Variovorax boronicumulans TaxID=436515 RepID=UPI002788947E|nr:N-6 DNA methylase [Variovorax boronicumulans]MDP9993832.1 adenine-specific DNA-methyltransferase [Variovorax boronicumulans]MDQ0005303.1 adenine-specific DNA-methyltransferase [Variovorax boronicumulans]
MTTTRSTAKTNICTVDATATDVDGRVPSRQSLLRGIKALGMRASELGLSPAHVAGTLLKSWCELDYSALPPSSLSSSQDLARQPSVSKFVWALRRMPFIEASYWLSSAYSVLCETRHRQQLAMFFTPASLTKGLLDDLVDQGVDFASHSFFDPACGGAAFLAPIAQRMRADLRKRSLSSRQVLEHIEANLYGTDMDPVLCELSKHFLLMALEQEVSETGWVPAFKVHPADSLRELDRMFGTMDVVVCNPPYRKMVAKELEDIREAYADVIEAQPNLYGLFIGLCVRLLRPGGYVALVTPTSFLSGRYFSRLRTYLMRTTDVLHIGIVSDRSGVFIDVEQETALVVMHRRKAAVQGAARTQVSVVSVDGSYKGVGECVLPGMGRAWPIPRAVPDVPLLRACARSSFRLDDYGYRVRIGAYVWNRDIRPWYESLKDVKKVQAKTAVPLIWSRDISPIGLVDINAAVAHCGEHRFVDLGDRHHSSVVRRPAVVLQRVTSNDQPRRLVAAAVPQALYAQFGGFVGENHIVILEQQEGSTFSPVEMAQLMSTEPMDRYFRCISGANNVSAFELRQLALPDPTALLEHIRAGHPMEKAVRASLGLERQALRRPLVTESAGG